MRIKIFLALLAAVVLATLGAVAITAANKSETSAHNTQETRRLRSFNRIEVTGLAEITLRQGNSEAVTIDASARQMRGIETSVDGETLKITVAGAQRWSGWLRASGDAGAPQIIVDLIKIDRIQSAGSVTLRARHLRAENIRLDFAGACKVNIDELQAARLRFEGSGVIKSQIAGNVEVQDIVLSGAGSYDAGNLVTDRTTVQVSGAGKATVNAKTSLKVDLSGAGVVEYFGNPTVQKDLSGISKVTHRAGP